MRGESIVRRLTGRPRADGDVNTADPAPAAAVLPQSFYARPVLEVARDLIGCGFFFHGVGGRIVETEADAPGEPCSHGFRGRTARNAIMFGPPGYLYVYFTYGMHYCCNLVCEEEGVAAAVLLRALEPLAGLDLMRERRGFGDPRALCSGPAKLSAALGIGRAQNGASAWQPPLLVTARPGAGVADQADWSAGAPPLAATRRIGVGGDERPWRFVEVGSRYLSRPFRAGDAAARESRR